MAGGPHLALPLSGSCQAAAPIVSTSGEACTRKKDYLGATDLALQSGNYVLVPMHN